MKPLGAAAADAIVTAKHRSFPWCRRHDGFCDKVIWRRVAGVVKLPLYQVVAVANRLEELANRARPRGYVGDFDAVDFAIALGMPEEDAARIFAALEEPAIGWVEQGYVQTFYERNPDHEDSTQAERKRRERARRKGMKELAQAFALGRISAEERRLLEAELLIDARLSTGHGSHIVTHRDIVTVTPDQTTPRTAAAVDNFGDAAHAEKGGPAEEASGLGGGDDPQAASRRWLESEGVRIVTERMDELRTKAETRIARWLEQELEGDAVTLAEIIRAADKADYMAARFHNLIVDGIRRGRQRQVQLPLPPAGLKRSTG